MECRRRRRCVHPNSIVSGEDAYETAHIKDSVVANVAWRRVSGVLSAINGRYAINGVCVCEGNAHLCWAQKEAVTNWYPSNRWN